MPQHELCKENPEFTPFTILNGRNWRLYLNASDQRYLGRSYLWLTSRHVDNMPFDTLDRTELDELMELMRTFRTALRRLQWFPVRINACWLGNEVHLHSGHGHMHLIPRYDREIVIGGQVFIDPQPGKNYTPHERLQLPESMLFHIRDSIKNHAY